MSKIRPSATLVRPLPDPVADVLQAVAACERTEGQRRIVAIAGPPAAGKSTLAERLRSELAPHAAVLGLDAFHFDNVILEARGHRERKGAPHTFDVAAYANTLRQLRAGAQTELSVPVFDRSLELSRNCAELVTAEHSIVITEGNYLLLDDDPWNELTDLFDLTIEVACELDEIERRILQRWETHGLDADAARTRAELNDLPNARHVVANSRPAMLAVKSAAR